MRNLPALLRSLLPLVLVLGLAAPAAAQRVERGPYLHTQLGAGYWHYFQSNYAPREADGLVLELHAAFAWAVGDEVALGTSFSGQMFYGGGHTTSGSQWPASATGGGNWGLLFVWMPAGEEPPVSVELSAGFAGGGMAQWGGFGPYISPSLTVFLAHAGRNHLGLTVRMQYEPMYSDDATPHGAVKNFVMADVSIGWTLF
jgi:hypothetical protein